MKIKKSVFILMFFSLYQMIVPTQATTSEPLQEAIAKTTANVVFMRHALAPGFGDPATFQIDECSTQRILMKLDAGKPERSANIFANIKLSLMLSIQPVVPLQTQLHFLIWVAGQSLRA